MQENMIKTIKENKQKYRELIKILVQHSPEVKNIKTHRDNAGEINGLISFEINTFEAGISTGVFYKFKPYLFSQFIISFLVNLIVRENFNEFYEVLNLFDFEMVNIFDENRINACGINIENEKTVFTFHVSKLFDLMKENPIK